MIGQTLGHYVIAAKIGHGGMGEVYRAHDTKLDRDVALKILPATFADDVERRKRFDLEARAIAALRHPNIVIIYSAEEVDGVAFLTMELLEGESLEDKLLGGALGPAEFLATAEALASAVAAAHAKGFAHRDLKPSNVMVEPDGQLKVLDFGLAKLLEVDGEDGSTQLMTSEGRVLGTAPYMSPEQVMGSNVDHRSDLFSLGAILYEMATGKRPFQRATSAETMTAILRDEPPDSTPSAPAYPAEVHRLIKQCLIKDREQRTQSALAIRDELRTIRESGSSPSMGTAAASRPNRLAWLLIAGACVLAVGYWIRTDMARNEVATPRASIDPSHRVLTQLTSTADLEEWPAWSPDGNRFVCSQEVEGVKRLVIHGIENRSMTPLETGPGDAIQAAWSSGGDRIAFVRSQQADRKLNPTDVYGYFSEGGDVWQVMPEAGEARLLVEDAFSPAWSPDGLRLAVDARWGGARRIWTTDAAGRNSRQITSDESEAVNHVSPSWSPDGRRIVYRIVETTQSDLAVVDVATGASWPLTSDQYQDLQPVWSKDGSAILFSSNRAGGINVWQIPVDADGRRSGVPEQLTQGPGQDLQIALSADGRRVLFTILGINSDIWRLPVDPVTGEAQGPAQPLVASTREDSRAAWSPDGSRIAFNSDRLGPMNIWIRDLTSGIERPLTEGEGGDYQPSWSPDGSWIAFFSSRTRNPEIWRVELESGALTQLTDDPALDSNPSISPDGEWIAFQSDRKGRKEVWLMRSDGSDERALTTVGTSDHFMRWTRDSRHLYCDDIDGSLTHRIEVATGEVLELTGIRGGAHMSLSPDEQSILDVTNHRVLWLSRIAGGEPYRVYEVPDPDLRLDYPSWSLDGRWVLFDRVQPSGGDIWMLDAHAP